MEKRTGDQLWNLRKKEANKIANLYHLLGMPDERFKISQCATQLKFIYGYPEYEYQNIPQRLIAANFCRLRHCPICQWRRSKKWQAKAFKALPSIMKEYPENRWLFLTLTIKSCKAHELRETIDKMNAAFKKWTQENYWVGIGWIKSLEITRGEGDLVHPHTHVLILAKGDYFGREYISQQKWAAMWQKNMKLDYQPIVDIRAVRQEDVKSAIPEILKYQCKPQDCIDGNGEWLFDIHHQLKGTRAIAVGGVLRNHFKETREQEEDLIGSGRPGLAVSPISSCWKWQEGSEEGYGANYSYNREAIDPEEAISNFMNWAGV